MEKRLDTLWALGIGFRRKRCQFTLDVTFAEPGAIVAFAGKRVIQATVKEELPADFQTSEYVEEKCGFIDTVIERKDLREKIGSILSILLKKNSDISSELNETSENSRTLTKAAS